MKRVICFLLFIIMLFSVFASCDGGVLENAESDTNTDSVTVPEFNEGYGTSYKDVHEERFEEIYVTDDGFKAINSQSYRFDKQVFGKYTDDYQNTILYIKKWNEYFTVPIAGENDNSEFNSCCANLISPDKGIYVVHQGGISDKLDICILKKGDSSKEIIRLQLPCEIRVNKMYCNFIDVNIGFLFVFEEGDKEKNHGYPTLSFLYKSNDGGETWNLVDSTDAPYVSDRNFPIYAEFLDENTGVFAGRDVYGEMERRSFMTFDGGKTWEEFPHFLPSPERITLSEVMKVEMADGEFIMTVRALSYVESDEPEKIIIVYTSPDMRNWKIEE